MSGTLDRLHVGDLLEWLRLTRATGRLQLSAGPTTRSFDVKRGKIAFASSSQASERLASWLLRQHAASHHVLLRALAISQTRGRLLTSVLLEESQMPIDVLIEAGRSLATTLASRIMQEEGVRFTFKPDWPLPPSMPVDLQLDCSSLIMQAAYQVDTLPPADPSAPVIVASLDSTTLEALFWTILEELEGEHIEAPRFAEAYHVFLKVGALLERWISQGPPLLPVGPSDIALARARLDAGQRIEVADAPSLVWDLLCIVNCLDAPGYPRAEGPREAWAIAGSDAPFLVSLILESPRWQRAVPEDAEETLRRLVRRRAAAARPIAAVLGLSDDVADSVAGLPVVLLELVVTALTASPLASPAMQRCALHHLLPRVGIAAGIAAGLPETIMAAITASPSSHPAVQLGYLLEHTAGALPGFSHLLQGAARRQTPALKAALAEARAAVAAVA
ncbi:MAG TPA: DUF4388 domain-containing protein [Thermoanaerobaculaceae bacterium]|nr:DUF4388 domain-containing protein [Thermoanaerobaculaceae bacterium]HRS16951.1 DUF4388 domain-containing protein [Thermoanaerobaculaceae bacterium]